MMIFFMICFWLSRRFKYISRLKSIFVSCFPISLYDFLEFVSLQTAFKNVAFKCPMLDVVFANFLVFRNASQAANWERKSLHLGVEHRVQEKINGLFFVNGSLLASTWIRLHFRLLAWIIDFYQKFNSTHAEVSKICSLIRKLMGTTTKEYDDLLCNDLHCSE